jgi:type IV secretory pathway VirB4 component
MEGFVLSKKEWIEMEEEFEHLCNIFKKKIAKIYHTKVQGPILFEKAMALKKLETQGHDIILQMQGQQVENVEEIILELEKETEDVTIDLLEKKIANLEEQIEETLIASEKFKELNVE